MNNIHAEVDEIFRINNKKAVVSLFLSMQGNHIRAVEAETRLTEAQAEIENLHWRVSDEQAKTRAALELNSKALELVNKAQADAEHWKSECNALQRMVHEARARIDHLERIIDEMTEEQAALCAEGQSITELVAAKDKLVEQMREALRLALPEARSTHVEQTILAALAAERGE